MNLIKIIFLNRNSILIIGLLTGLICGEFAIHIKTYTVYILAIVMTFSTSGIKTKALWPPKDILKPMLVGALLNYLVFGLVIIGLAWLLMPEDILYYGFIIIAAAPPGVSVIPFTYILKGNVDYAILGTLGAFIASIFMAPFIVKYFGNSNGINSQQLFMMMVKLVVVPMILSRFLLIKQIFPVIEKIRGKVVDWGFAIIIFVAVGINRQVFFSDYKTLLLVTLTLFAGTFILGWLYDILSIKIFGYKTINIAENLLVTTKSSGFSVVTAMTLFGERAAIPSAVLAVLVLMYFLFRSLTMQLRIKNKVHIN